MRKFRGKVGFESRRAYCALRNKLCRLRRLPILQKKLKRQGHKNASLRRLSNTRKTVCLFKETADELLKADEQQKRVLF